MKKVFVNSIQERDRVDAAFLVRDKVTAMAKNGKPYLTLKLMDRTGEVEGRVWDNVDEFTTRFEKNDILQVQAKASVYLGKMQIVIQDLQKVPEHEVDLSDFLPTSVQTTEELVSHLRRRIDTLTNPHLRGLMDAFFADKEFLKAYSTAPAAKAMHHVYLGGLLEHSLSISELVDDVGRHYPELNRDLLVVGGLLHDVGKVVELSYLRSFDYTDEGKLLGHITIGVEILDEKIKSLNDFPRPLAVQLKHLLLSHHGQYEFGSPKRPKTLEAVVLSYIDDLDSKMNGIRSHIDKDAHREGNWTSYHRLYDRYFYKGDAPVDAAAPDPDEISQESAPVPDHNRPETQPAKQKPLSAPLAFSLGDQLKGQSLDLFANEKDES